MTEVEEVEQSCQDKPEAMDNDPVEMKDTETEEVKDIETEEVKDIENEEVKDIETEEVKDIEIEEVKPEEEADEVEPKGEAVQEEDEDEETESEDEAVEQDKNLQPCLADVSSNGLKEAHMENFCGKISDEILDSPEDAVENGIDMQTGSVLPNVDDRDPEGPEASLKFGLVSTQKSAINDDKEPVRPDVEEDNGVKLDVSVPLNHQNVDDETIPRVQVEAASNTQSSSSPSKIEHKKEEEVKDGAKIEEGPADAEKRNSSNVSRFDADTSGGGDSGTEQEQAAFIMELHKFHKERGLDFKPPKFYGEPLNLLRLWRAVLRLGGYDKVTACKHWRPVGESFKPPKTCTTISWTFRIFYEKALLEYERYRASADGIGLPALEVPMAVGDEQAPGSGRARRDAAARAMQGWHSQRVLDNGEVSDPIVKDKSSGSLSKKERPLKSLGGILKRKNTSSAEDVVKPVQMKLPKLHSDATVIDIGSPADWVKINVRATRDCYEVYALVPGLLREEVRVQSDPAGRLVISGEPENPDNPWNVTPFKKVVSLPSRIDPHQTSAVVTLHGQLFVRVPFEQYD